MGLDPVRNFAVGTLTAGITSGATTFSLGSGQGSLFPAPASEGAFNAVIWNSTDYDDPLQDSNHEIVRVTARSTDAFTVTRAQESTSAVAHNTSGKSYSLAIVPTRKMIQDIDARLTDQAQAYAADTGAANAYVITLAPAPTAYAAGQTFVFKAANTNTTTSTLNVNGLGAKTIKSNVGGAALAAGQITAGDMVRVAYDGTDFKMVTGVTVAAVQGATFNYAVSGGAANVQTLTLSPAITAYATGQTFKFKSGFTNTGPVTMNVNGQGAKAMVDREGAALVGGELQTNGIYTMTYDGTSFLVAEVLAVCDIAMTGAAGNGSTDTMIREFVTTVRNLGTAVTLANNATNGMTLTVVKSGVYSITYKDRASADCRFGLSRNSAQLTTGIEAITNANRLMNTQGPAGTIQNCSWAGWLNAGDVVRCHTNSTTAMDVTADEQVGFAITRVG